MADFNQHIQTLQMARDREVTHRREVAKSLAGEYKKGDTERWRDDIVKIQNAIAAIERAIAHEEYIASKEPQTFWPHAFDLPRGLGR